MEEHWRDIQESDYLASWDLIQPKEELTISEVKTEIANIKDRPKKVIAYFIEKQLKCGTKVKPMILNNTNLKFLQTNTRLGHQSLWKNLKVEISVVDNTSKIGGSKRLVITKLLSTPKFDIESFKKITDYAEAKSNAISQSSLMSNDDKEEAKKHIESLKPKKQ